MPLNANLFIKKRSGTTALKQPKELGYYSKTADNQFLVQDDSNLCYYYFPDSCLERNIDLTGGIKKFRDSMADSNVDHSTLHGLLSTIQKYEERKEKKIKADIITFRGVMRKLISCALENPKYNKVSLYVVSFNEQLIIKDATKVGQPSTGTDSIDYRNYYSGYKFETLTTLSKSFSETPRQVLESRPKKIVSNGEQFVTVVRTGIGKCKLILGAEVDCVFDFKEVGSDNLKHYAELKCSKAVNTVADARTFELKLFKTWVQCFLVGINRIIYGFRDENCILKSVEEFSTQEIPVLLKNNPRLTNACLDAIKWYGAFTEWLLDTIPRESNTKITAYTLEFEHNHLKLSEIEPSHPEYDGIVNGEVVLSETFKQWRTNLQTKDSNS
ncbi:decapping nuclease Ecym_2600 [Eremothecium cymbalariae DBVPG|uniref:Decapping nuclease n=1 Tax=Eremothecium cymbalariae (strain CBS 270.75 / DBVPG 7215 / KCTC 17166 / NRRL Y-17582) TaxID=931890 RepID=G8JQI0_ERECY|nr:Hypothetical protein Ecym_2600 [Eremothecium cymbalariae DBVPG\